MTAEQIQAESRQRKAAFHAAWETTLRGQADTLAKLPPMALAYEMAWRAFCTGIRYGHPAAAQNPAGDPSTLQGGPIA